ncbi:hypothetical protein AZE42_08933 [Rhizopogon vesiculosus]|uniref:Uncharacterized protein n=1 Tax=Rhizopogon vesiculosus TaxID=180088 RepID=A0A1J8PZA5_9AGAM|nr:hypothetical protein AZE42_08933 [Rhizopogon vesiculosus]
MKQAVRSTRSIFKPFHPPELSALLPSVILIVIKGLKERQKTEGAALDNQNNRLRHRRETLQGFESSEELHLNQLNFAKFGFVDNAEIAEETEDEDEDAEEATTGEAYGRELMA